MFRKNKYSKQYTDRELIWNYKNSKKTKYIAILFDKYSHLVFGTCLKYLNDTEKAKDAMMAIFEKLMDELLKKEIGNFNSYLYIMSKNHCLMEIRKSNKLSTQDFDTLKETFKEEETLETAYIKERKLEDLETAITTLPVEQQTCIQLFYFEKLNYTEISEKTGFEVNKVKSYLQNGKRKLKLILTQTTTNQLS